MKTLQWPLFGSRERYMWAWVACEKSRNLYRLLSVEWRCVEGSDAGRKRWGGRECGEQLRKHGAPLLRTVHTRTHFQFQISVRSDALVVRCADHDTHHITHCIDCKVSASHPAILKLLLENGADVTLKNIIGRTALDNATLS